MKEYISSTLSMLTHSLLHDLCTNLQLGNHLCLTMEDFTNRSSTIASIRARCSFVQEMPTVFPSSHSTRDNSIPNIVCREVRSSMNPYIVIPALLFSKYVTKACLFWNEIVLKAYAGRNLELSSSSSSSPTSSRSDDPSELPVNICSSDTRATGVSVSAVSNESIVAHTCHLAARHVTACALWVILVALRSKISSPARRLREQTASSPVWYILTSALDRVVMRRDANWLAVMKIKANNMNDL